MDTIQFIFLCYRCRSGPGHFHEINEVELAVAAEQMLVDDRVFEKTQPMRMVAHENACAFGITSSEKRPLNAGAYALKNQ